MARRDYGMTPTNSLEVLESPLTLLPGMEPVFSLTIEGSGTIDVSGITDPMLLYKGTKDVSSTNLSGSVSVNDRTISLKKIVSLTPGDWVFYVTFNDGGVKTTRFCRFTVGKLGT